MATTPLPDLGTFRRSSGTGRRVTPTPEATFTTLNGLSANANLEVVDEQGDAIGGLFANGNDCGGTYAHVYPSRFTGLHMGRTLSFAWHIAHELAER